MKLSESSVWSVGAERATEVHDGFVVLPVHVDVDWDAGIAQGMIPDEHGAEVWTSLLFSYVTAGGRSFDTNNFPDAEIPNPLFDVGVVYPPATSVSGNVAIAVPADQIPGGVWKVENTGGDAVFIVGAP